MGFNTLMAAVDKLIEKRLIKFKVEYRQWLSKYGINKQNHINDPSGGAVQDTEARTAIQEIIDTLEANGLNKKS